METTIQLIKANATRVVEILSADSPYTPELINKMHELRRDTKRLEHFYRGRIKVCDDCQLEFVAERTYLRKCYECEFKSKFEYQKKG